MGLSVCNPIISWGRSVLWFLIKYLLFLTCWKSTLSWDPWRFASPLPPGDSIPKGQWPDQEAEICLSAELDPLSVMVATSHVSPLRMWPPSYFPDSWASPWSSPLRASGSCGLAWPCQSSVRWEPWGRWLQRKVASLWMRCDGAWWWDDERYLGRLPRVFRLISGSRWLLSDSWVSVWLTVPGVCADGALTSPCIFTEPPEKDTTFVFQESDDDYDHHHFNNSWLSVELTKCWVPFYELYSSFTPHHHPVR